MTLRDLYDQLEDDNHHNLTAMLCAVAARDYDAVLKLADILNEHVRGGGLTGRMSRTRYEISQPLYESLVKDGRI